MISRSRRDSVGREVVAEFSRDLQKPGQRDSVGGVVAEFVRHLRQPTRFSGGGVVAGTVFPLSPVAKSDVYPTFSDIRDTHFA